LHAVHSAQSAGALEPSRPVMGVLTSLTVEPRAAAENFFPGTLKTSLCATRLFPTADYPERNSLRHPAQGLGHIGIFESSEKQNPRPQSVFKSKSILLSNAHTPAGVVTHSLPAASDVGNIRGAHRESRASVGREWGTAHAEAPSMELRKADRTSQTFAGRLFHTKGAETKLSETSGVNLRVIEIGLIWYYLTRMVKKLTTCCASRN
jgi:hypothetical protein